MSDSLDFENLEDLGNCASFIIMPHNELLITISEEIPIDDEWNEFVECSFKLSEKQTIKLCNHLKTIIGENK